MRQAPQDGQRSKGDGILLKEVSACRKRNETNDHVSYLLSLSLSLWVFYNYFKSINTCPLTFQTDLLLRLQKSSIVKLFEGKIVNYNCLLIWNYPWISKPMWLNFIPTSTLICFFGNFQSRSVSFFNCDEAIWRIEKHLHSWRVLFLASSLYFRSSSHYW